MNLEQLYDQRFNDKDNTEIWKEICLHFNNNFIANDDIVCDIACGNGEFINNISSNIKYGIDLRKSTELKTNINFLQKSVLDLESHDFNRGIPNIFFMSNFLEHLNTKNDVYNLLCTIKKVLEKSNADKKMIIIMGPNIDFVKEKYWDFFDHILPFNEKSIEEGLRSAGFEIEYSKNKFLPYTTKSKIPQHPLLVRLYLKSKLAWKILGKQFLVIGRS